jgi:hypothetical protein
MDDSISAETQLAALDEARELAEYHRQAMRFHLRLARYWQERAQRVAAEWPGLTQAEEIAAAAWGRD